MRFDKLTTQFQQAFSDAQSLAVGGDHAYIEPQHLLLALLNQEGAGAGAILSRGSGAAAGAGRGRRSTTGARPGAG